MRTIRSIRAMQHLSHTLKGEQKHIGMVPTMGSLHAGHIALIHSARRRTDCVVVSVFVNPIQFNEQKDYEAYPKDLKRDTCLAKEAGADVFFIPRVEEIYPSGYGTFVDVKGITDRWEGKFRTGHFSGVATVVAKLFSLVQPDIALFGQKDYQQVRVIQKMVRDLNLPTRVLALPTVREKDGLAISSRNIRLTPQARKMTPRIYQSLRMGRSLFQKGERRPHQIQKALVQHLLKEKGFKIEYIGLCHPETLEPVKKVTKGTIILLAVRLAGVRLIDNILLK